MLPTLYEIFPNQNNSTDETICSPLENLAFLHDLLKMKTIFFYLRSVKICGQFQFLNAHIGKVKKQKIGHHSSYLLEKSGQISAAGFSLGPLLCYINIESSEDKRYIDSANITISLTLLYTGTGISLNSCQK